MEERQVTAEGETRALPRPFFVIATQNPSHQIGTFPLPESQLDRFLMRLELGYPNRDQERVLLGGEDRRAMVSAMRPIMDTTELLAAQAEVEAVHASPPIIDYCLAILEFTRASTRFRHGLSPRAGLGLLRAAKAWAMVEGRDFVTPDDIQAVLPGVVPHRLLSSDDADPGVHRTTAELILDAVAVP
jgi:MoxR-like ATPase